MLFHYKFIYRITYGDSKRHDTKASFSNCFIARSAVFAKAEKSRRKVRFGVLRISPMESFMKKINLFIVFALLIFSWACSFDSGSPNGKVIFQDDFSNDNSGWPRIREEEGITDYENGVYRILVNLENQDYFGVPNISPVKDVRVEVDATKVAGSDDNDFGILCRYQDNNNYYQFLVSSDGYVGILKVVNGSLQNIAAENLIEHSAVNTGDALNHIRADCIGEVLTLFVNDQQVATAQDIAFTGEGRVGVFAGTYDEPGTEINFDNFIVFAP
jgi:hypothetical protein